MSVRWKWRLLMLEVCTSIFELVSRDYIHSRTPDLETTKIMDRIKGFRERAAKLREEVENG